MDIDKMEKDIQALIDSGKIKNEKEIKEIPIDEISERLNICVKDLICYYCYKGAYNTKCDNPVCDK